MTKILVLLVSIFLFSCGSLQYNSEMFQAETDTPESEPIIIEDCPRTKNEQIPFYDFLPYEENQKENTGPREPFNKLSIITPFFPEGEELQKCVASILFVVRTSGAKRLNFVPFAICFNTNRSTRISRQMRNELRIFVRILAQHPDNHLILIIPDEIRNRERARQRIRRIREFLIEEGADPERIIENSDTPPE